MKFFYYILTPCQKSDIKGRIYGKGCGTVSMMPKSYYKEAYELGKNI